MIASGRWHDLCKEALCNLEFIQAKFATKGHVDLLESYEKSLHSDAKGGPGAAGCADDLRAFQHFVIAEQRVLAETPLVTLQQARNAPEAPLVCRMAKEELLRKTKAGEPRVVLECKNKTLGGGTEIMTVDAHVSKS
jgi:hypothetical protein